MADKKSQADEDVMKDTVEASEIQNEGLDDDAVRDKENEEIDISGESDDLDDSDSASLETQVEELKEALIRSQADLQNVQRRAARDVENAHKYAVEKFVKDLLAVLDSMDRALELAKTTEGFDVSMLEGTEMTHKLLLDTAAKHGVELINPVGEAFDPQEHQAMSMVESADHDPNTVMAVMQKGYKLEGRVIRAAMVMVTKGASN
ncbi:MAG: nucleotide exchange factor GrpE [Pseudomonadota bacterium]|nr:nucleotide exchange factor GrpE [Pseudomonadota bacterium]MEE2820754.1 nucleotide exchange factor GrpE [Pseudomonadota bacterium]